MTKKEVTKLLNKCLDPFFNEHGFKAVSNDIEIGWTKTADNNIITMDYGFVSQIHPDTGARGCFIVNPTLSISNIEIETYLRNISPEPSKIPIDSMTVYVKFAELENDTSGFFTGPHFNYDWEICYEGDVQKIGEQLIEKVKSVMFPSYEKLKTKEQIDILYNDINSLNKVLIYPAFIPNRALKGLVVAKLVGNNNIEHLINYYSKEVAKWPERYHKNFEALIKKN